MKEVVFSCRLESYFFTRRTKMKKLSTRIMVKISILTAMSVIFYYFEFRVIPSSPLKVDLSDIPVLIGAWLMGPLAGFMIAFLKNLVHFLTISSDCS